MFSPQTFPAIHRIPRTLLGAAAAVVLVAGSSGFARATQLELDTRPHDERPHSMAGRIFDVAPAEGEIELDGAVDEAAWKKATRLPLDFEVEPGENIPPPVRTEVLVTYDENNVYFAFVAEDPRPEEIRARLSDRDRAWDDDWVGVVLDTFNDQRRAYELFSNPLGVQIDAINDEVGQNYDDSWNAIWNSAGRITDRGYEVEMAIPFNQVRFQSIDGDQVWGFDAIRSYPRDFRHHITVFPRDRAVNSYLSQAIKIRGMRGANPGSNFEVIPTITSSRSDVREDIADANYNEGPILGDVGVSLRWGLTPNTSLNGAVNPDFSQIEADALQLDVNEQFALFFNETRPFFLEGADYFNSGQRLVHTRSIADPIGAAKLTGKQGSHTWGLFSARDEITNILVPGAEGSSSGAFTFDNTSSVARYRYDFGSNSTLGGTITDRRGEGYSNTVYSTDAVLNLDDTNRIRANAAFSHTDYNEEIRGDLGLSANKRDDLRLGLDLSHQKRGGWVNLDLDHVGENYRADLGFQPRVGFQSTWLGGAKVWWGEEGDVVQRMAWGNSYFRSNRDGGGLLEQEFSSWFNANLPMQTFVRANGEYRQQRFDGRDFYQWRASTNLSTRINGDLSAAFNARGGGAIDFAESRPGTNLTLVSSLRYKFGRHVDLQTLYIYRQLNIDRGRLFSVHAPELRLVHQFNARAFVRLVLQYTRVNRDQALYSDSVDATSESLLTQLLLTYKVNPQTAFYLGYGDNQFGDDLHELTRTDRTVFAKLGYAWVR